MFPRISLLSSLADKLRERLTSEEIIYRATKQNSWFTRDSISMAVDAICSNMLSKDKLNKWLSNYTYVDTPKNIAIIMAGNIPLVGFFDLLSVIITENNAYVKLSSKDSILMQEAIDVIKMSDENIVIEPLDGQPIDGVIATGSDNAARYIISEFGNTAMLLRSNRYSVAVIDESESEEEIVGLWHDIFSHFSLGCRNVSKIFIPKGYKPSKLIDIWQKAGLEVKNEKYTNNHRQSLALSKMRGTCYIDGGYFLMTYNTTKQSLSEIALLEYNNIEEVAKTLKENDENLQCVVSRKTIHPRTVRFGEAQQPTLEDYADGKDVIFFLNSL